MGNSAARVVSTRVAGNLTRVEFADAATPTRSLVPAFTRSIGRSPVGSTGPAQKSERTSPGEGSRIRSTGSRRKGSSRGKRRVRANAMDKGTADSWSQRTAFVGFDWASDHHDVLLVDQHGKIVEDFRFDDSAEGWRLLIRRLSRHPDHAVAIETSTGATVERLLEAGYALYPVNPKAAKRYRDRKAPSGTRTDRIDAWSLADALRLDGHTWRQLEPDDPLTVELRLLCRDEMVLIEQRTALVCQLRAALHEYYPVALEAFDDWTLPSAWTFVETFPTPAARAGTGKRKWEKFLHTHKLQTPGDLREAAQAVCPGSNIPRQPGGHQGQEHAGRGSGRSVACAPAALGQVP